MNPLFPNPKLPDRPAKLMLVSGEYPFLAAEINRLGIQTVETAADDRLPYPVRFHPDMQVCLLRETLFVLRQNGLADRLRKLGLSVNETACEPGGRYPRDVLCNAFVLDGIFVGNQKFIDSAVRNSVEKSGLRFISVRQGYASCSTVLVNRKSAITADSGIADALEQQGVDVLRIQPGCLRLPGYNSGFIGGCCGLLSEKQMAFTGRLDSHPDGCVIRAFLQERNIDLLELSGEDLLDVGGILPLR